MTQDKPIRVAVYARVSTEHEAQVLALDNQLEWYDNIIKQNPNYIEVGRYIDEGITGTSAKKREGFMRMIRDAEQGKFDLIITREVSRFARNTKEMLKYVDDLKKWGVVVYFINDGLRTDEPDGELRLTIMSGVAQEESRKISERVLCGQAISRQKGVIYGNGNVLGYDRIKRETSKNNFVAEFVVNPEQAETVRKIFNWYLQGNGIRKIQFLLEQEGHKTSEGNTNWHSSVVSKTLKNRLYTGYIEYRREYNNNYKDQKRIINHGEKERPIVKGPHEAIISVEDFNKVQEIMKKHCSEIPGLQTGKKSVGQKPNVNVWSKLLKCSCGHSFNRHKWAHKGSNTVYGYQCYGSLQTGTVKTRLNKGLSIDGVCTTPMVPEWKLKMMAKFVFTNFVTDIDEILTTANAILKKHIVDKPVHDNTKLIETKKKELLKLENRLKRYVEMRADDEISREQYFEYKAEIETQIDKLKKTITELDVVSEPIEEIDFDERIKMLEYAMEQLVDFENMDDIPETVIEAFVEKIIVSKDCFDWYLRFNPSIAYTCKVEGKRSGTGTVSASFAFLKDKKLTSKYNNLNGCEYVKITSFILDKEYAKKYMYAHSPKHRVHNYKDTNVNLYI